MIRASKLQSRFFLWLLLSIVLALASAVLTMWLTGEGPTNRPAQVMAKAIAARLDALWDDPKAVDDDVARMRQATGYALVLRRDVASLPPSVDQARTRGSALALELGGSVYVPIVHAGALVGALQFDAPHIRGALFRLAAALSVAVVVLGLMARRVSRQLARPLERVAAAAERFGAGNLAVRTDITGAPERWVAVEVRDVAVAFDTMAERIEAIVKDQRELLGAISHELRSPLGRARVALEIARERDGAGHAAEGSPVTGSARELDRIETELGSVDAILGDLLAVTRAGLSDLRKESVDLTPWLRARLASEQGPPALELDAEGAATARVAIDSALLGRALHNVIENARAHGHPPGEPIIVRVEETNARARIIVRDRGPGFPADLIDRAFDPFVRGDSARTPARGGSGLGLALVRRIAEAHGGRAFAENVERDGKVAGAEVGIELPVAGP